ncbi:MAG: hypothetical protein K8R23_07935 [Chthoniobacter sp.]|nr:hypothetical protein [Chthoniobacter sp.]
MSANRRRHANSVPVAKFFAIAVAGSLVCVLGLGYVWCTNDMNTTGVKIKKVEKELVQLRQRNEAALAGIDSVNSTAYLNRQFHRGLFGKLELLERLKIAGRVSVVAVPSGTGAMPGELRRVVNERKPQ